MSENFFIDSGEEIDFLLGDKDIQHVSPVLQNNFHIGGGKSDTTTDSE